MEQQGFTFYSILEKIKGSFSPGVPILIVLFSCEWRIMSCFLAGWLPAALLALVFEVVWLTADLIEVFSLVSAGLFLHTHRRKHQLSHYFGVRATPVCVSVLRITLGELEGLYGVPGIESWLIVQGWSVALLIHPQSFCTFKSEKSEPYSAFKTHGGHVVLRTKPGDPACRCSFTHLPGL